MDNLYKIKTLKQFTYIDESGMEMGGQIQVLAEKLVELCSDHEELKIVRDKSKNQSREMGSISSDN